jgi:hypothetical protein
MKRLRWGLIKRQVAVQVQVITLNLYSLGLFVIQPAVFTAVGMLLSHAAGNAMPDLVYNVIGGGIMGMWSGLVFTSTFDIVDDRRTGVLEFIVGSPTSLATVEAIRTLTNVIAGLFSLSVAFIAQKRELLGSWRFATFAFIRNVVHRGLSGKFPGLVAYVWDICGLS